MKFLTPDARFGATRESLMARRERSAVHEGQSFGKELLTRELVSALGYLIPHGASVLEVDAGPGHITRLLATRASKLTVLEPAPLFVRDLEKIRAESCPTCEIYAGFTENLPEDAHYDIAVVSFPARRGVGLLALANELAALKIGTIITVMPDDGSLDWAYLTRACALEGFEVNTEFCIDHSESDVSRMKRAVLVTVTQTERYRDLRAEGVWDLEARTIHVPYPVPRGAATRLVRYFIAGGDRAVMITTEAQGLNRLYGNLRTAAHRIARDEVTVRRVDDGVQLMLIPKTE